MGGSREPTALGACNMIGDPVLEGGSAIARQPGLDWSDPCRPDPPGQEPEEWEAGRTGRCGCPRSAAAGS
jgi:hypothetical protein